MKWTIAGLLGGAVLGGIIGATGVLCPTGDCAITGSWYGGAAIGAVIGLVLTGGGCPCSAGACAREPRARRKGSKPDANAGLPDDENNPYRTG